RSARWTCTSAACATRSRRAATRASWRPSAAPGTGSFPSAERAVIAIAASLLASGVAWYFAGIEWGLGTFTALLLAQLAYELAQRRGLRRWLEHGETPEPPRARGAWDEVHALIHRARRESARREAELAHALARWRAAARALPDGVVILDGERIAWCNDNASLHLGVDPTRDVGNAITHLVRIPEFHDYLEAGDFTPPVHVPTGQRDQVLSLHGI